jgi:hypothetical protein
LANEGQRLELLNMGGDHAEVLNRAKELRAQMQELPYPPGKIDRTVNIWNAREVIFNVGRAAAQDLEEWQQALDLNAEVLQSKKDSSASLLEQARTRINDHGPLLRLRRYAETRELLDDCQAVFGLENDVASLAVVFAARGNLEDELGHPDDALHFGRMALRYTYAADITDKNRHQSLQSREVSHPKRW